ncbi:hypothetical protein FS749_003366 [Ceratobasidium sp. UAMH 11750]|nr:hypothetical protein FS749_003366 [Ceratobasidium sp. UAMH 11750]
MNVNSSKFSVEHSRSVDFSAASNVAESPPIAVILPGLTEGSHEYYIRALLADLTCFTIGFRAVVSMHTAAPAFPSLALNSTMVGRTGDLRRALLYLDACFPSAPLVGVGFSVGANMLAST